MDPLTDTVTVHKVEIIRDGKVVDITNDGQAFTILRRESGMAEAVIDGRLTGVKELHDLRVGDIVRFARSTRTTQRVPGLKPEFADGINFGGVADRVRIRVRWAQDQKLQWRTSEGLSDVKLTQDGGESELLYDATDVQRPILPEDAPDRFLVAAELEVSGFSDWRQLSSLFAPIYAKTSVLKADSPLKAVAAKIRRENATPEAQASAALRLVEQDVRYLALAAGEAGLIPATADETWSSRFGDCKGKTILLIALLNELGIKAEPALAASRAGDGVRERLPRVSAFDHVIVRAEINGRIYWLDGTRTTDRRIETAPPPALGWVLPLRASGADLEEIPLPRPTKPTFEYSVVLDASKGLDADGPAYVETILRGYSALELEALLSLATKQQAEDFLRERYDDDAAWLKVDKVSYGYDDALDAYRIRLDGHGKFEWDFSQGLRQEDMEGQFVLKFDPRTKGIRRDAPYTVGLPTYTVHAMKVRLPEGGKGFELIGSDSDVTIGGVSVKRTSAISNGEAVVTLAIQRPMTEIAYRDADDLSKKFAAQPTARNVVLRAPRSLSLANRDRPAATKLSDADNKETRLYELRSEATMRYQHGEIDKALDLINQALKIDPQDKLSRRFLLFLYNLQRKPAQALKEAKTSAEMFKDDLDIQLDYAQALITAERPADALKFVDQALAAGDGSDSLYLARAVILMNLDRTAEAVALYDERLQAVGPRNSRRLMLGTLASNIAGMKEPAKAKAVAALDATPNSAVSLYLKGRLAKSPEDSAAQYAAALKVKGDFFDALREHGFTLGIMKQTSAAIADLDRAIRLSPKDTGAYRVRAQLYEDAGRMEEAALDLDEIVDLEPMATNYNNRCWFRATHNLELDKALADCDQAIKLATSPYQAGAYWDSRGLVNLRLGRLDQALTDYDKALAERPTSAASIYGRGLVRKAQGDTAGWAKDMNEAKRFDPEIIQTFSGYGLKP